MKAAYVYIWEFLMVPEHRELFEHTYGVAGEWVKLFQRAPGYIKTELLRDRFRPERYISVDYWESEEAWEWFRSKFSTEFTALDKKCEEWTSSERQLGRFQPVE